ncbi:LuxR C-terminal-related transcriptional regulator [Mariniflexile sp. AS56]|uniref:LuxR C-terminal-related transcriptional regulator n=1 Tax=Mariniflexile sp. AS56 TaxID=3063957 RepID=UPI0026EA6AAA|nr:LuxR C-terminal-related transcriptional regulator [Mariniflexile sp. AS56]MDO7170673.1 LuxR C-terminal-related transcriptional regulator [Mariniflexile sp. AS56]
MSTEIDKLKNVWDYVNKTAIHSTVLPKLNFEELLNSITSIGPFYFYIIDFYDMSLSNVSPSIYDIHGLDPETVTFDTILNTIHPDDMDFVAKAEHINIDFLYKNIGKDKILHYKSNYSFRSKMKNGNYELLNHQAIVLTVDESGRFGKALNIHTNISHLTKVNTNQISLIGLNGFMSYMNIEMTPTFGNYITYTKREIEIIKCISKGLSSKNISNILHISEATVKKHRNNISKKSGCKNSVELLNKSMLQGLI